MLFTTQLFRRRLRTLLRLALGFIRFTASLRFTLHPLLLQRLGITLGRPPDLLHPLRMCNPLQLLVAPCLRGGALLLLAPSLRQRALVAPRLGFLARCFGALGLLFTLDRLLALGKLGALLLIAFGGPGLRMSCRGSLACRGLGALGLPGWLRLGPGHFGTPRALARIGLLGDLALLIQLGLVRMVMSWASSVAGRQGHR